MQKSIVNTNLKLEIEHAKLQLTKIRNQTISIKNQ